MMNEDDYEDLDDNFIRIVKAGTIIKVDIVDFIENLQDYLEDGISGASLGYRRAIDLEKLRRVLK